MDVTVHCHHFCLSQKLPSGTHIYFLGWLHRDSIIRTLDAFVIHGAGSLQHYGCDISNHDGGTYWLDPAHLY